MIFNFKSFAIALMLFCGLFQGLFLEDIFGSSARSAGFFLIPVVFLFLVIFNRNKLLYFKKFIVFLLFYVLLIYFYLLNFYYSNQEFLYIKSPLIPLIKVSYMHLLIFLSFFCFYNIYKINRKKNVNFWVLFFYFTCIAFIFIDYFLPLPSFMYHEILAIGAAEEESRPYGLAYEASSAVVAFSALSLMAIISINKSRSQILKSTLIFIIFIFLLFFVGSKGGLISLVLSIIASTILFLFSDIKKFLAFFPILLICLILISQNTNIIIDEIYVNVIETTSLSTRLMSLISSILIFINNPFGIGPALFINEYHNAISYVYDSALALKIPANYSEIIFSLETGISLWPKGTMASLLPQYGIFSLILFLLTYFIIVRSVFVNTKIQTQDIFVILIGQTMFFQ